MRAADLPKFDAAEHLTTPEAQAAYLRLSIEEDSPEDFRRALNTVARARGMTRVARASGLTREGLYKALGEGGNPSFATVTAVMRALGMKITAKPAANRKKRTVANAPLPAG